MLAAAARGVVVRRHGEAARREQEIRKLIGKTVERELLAQRERIRQAFGVDTAGRNADWKADEILFTLERPGGDAWLRIALDNGDVEYSSLNIDVLNDAGDFSSFSKRLNN